MHMPPTDWSDSSILESPSWLSIQSQTSEERKENNPRPRCLGRCSGFAWRGEKILGEKQAKQARPRLVTSQRLPLPRFSSVQLGMEYCAYFITTTVWRKPKPDEEEMRESGARGWPPRQLILTDDVSGDGRGEWCAGATCVPSCRSRIFFFKGGGGWGEGIHGPWASGYRLHPPLLRVGTRTSLSPLVGLAKDSRVESWIG